MAGTIADAVNFALSKVGWAYCNEGPWRLDGSRHCYDCSGLVWAAIQAAHGPGDFPQNSDTQYAYCARAGDTLPVGEAIHTYGAVLFRGTQNTYDGFGHVVFSLGDGLRTVEAMGHAYGIVIGNSDPVRRGWSSAAFVPTMTYGLHPSPLPPALPPVTVEDEPMFATISVQGDKPYSRPYAWLDTKNRKLLTYHGARIDWHGGTPAGGQHDGTHDPYSYTIPGAEPVLSVEALSRPSASSVEFVVYGLAGGEYLGQLHR